MDVMLEGADCPRQIDVLVKSNVAGFSIQTVVEARDYAKRLDITHLDAFHSKMQDVKAHKGVMVSRKGFSNSAKSKADRLGISLCTLNNPETDLKDVGLEIPILLTDISSLKLNCTCSAHFNAGDTIHVDSLYQVNDIPIPERVNKAFLRGEIPIPTNENPISWTPPELGSSIFIRSPNGKKIEVQDWHLTITPSVEYLFGYASELSNSFIFENLSDNSTSLIFSWPDLESLRSHLFKYKSFEKIPKIDSSLKISGISYPEINSPDAMDRRFSMAKQGSNKGFSVSIPKDHKWEQTD